MRRSFHIFSKFEVLRGEVHVSSILIICFLFLVICLFVGLVIETSEYQFLSFRGRDVGSTLPLKHFAFAVETETVEFLAFVFKTLIKHFVRRLERKQRKSLLLETVGVNIFYQFLVFFDFSVAFYGGPEAKNTKVLRYKKGLINFTKGLWRKRVNWLS